MTSAIFALGQYLLIADLLVPEQQTAIVHGPSRDADSLLNFRLESDIADETATSCSAEPPLHSHLIRPPAPLVVWSTRLRAQSHVAVRALRHGYVTCLKSQRVRREVLRWSARLSIFALGAGVGAVVALRDASPDSKAIGNATTLGIPVPNFKSEIAPAGHQGASVTGTTGDRSLLAVDTGSAPSSARPAAAAGARRRGHRGALIVTSQPQGARVFVNNRFAGQTPLFMRSELAGSRALRLTLDGYAPWSRGIRIVANQSTSVTAKLTPTE